MKIKQRFLHHKQGDGLRGEFQIIWKFFYNNFFAYVLLYLQNFLINRYMPEVSLGQFSYGQTMLQLFASIYSMEVYSVYLRYIGYSNEKDLLRKTRRILLIATALFVVTAWVFFHSPLYVLFFGYMWMRERLYFFRSKLEIGTYGRIKILQYLGATAILVLLIITGRLNERTMLAGMGVSYLAVSLVYNRGYTEKETVEEGLPAVSTGEILHYAVPLSFNAIVVWVLGAADQMLIDTYLDAMTLTYYSVAFRLIGVIRIATGVLMEYWPRFYFERMESRDYAAVRTMKLLFLAVAAALCVGSIIMSKPLYVVMGASKYVDARWMFCILAGAEAFRLWGSILMTFQSYVKNTSINVICLGILGAVKLLINWILLRRAGVSILLYTTLGCYLLYCLCGIHFGSVKERNYCGEFPAQNEGS